MSAHHTRPLALLLRVEAILVSIAASVPELSAGVGLLVVIPADVVVPTRALVQDQAAAGVQGHRLCRGHVKKRSQTQRTENTAMLLSQLVVIDLCSLHLHDLITECVNHKAPIITPGLKPSAFNALSPCVC